MAPGNYGRWRDGKSQTGETREALCSEIKGAMQQHGIHHRENANIRTQISELERSFDAARNWLKENRYDRFTFKRVTEEEQAGNNDDGREEELGVGKKDDDDDDDEGVVVGGAQGPAEAHVLRMCRYYHTLNEVFGQDEGTGVRHRRANAQRNGNHSVSTRKRKGTPAGADSEHKMGQPKDAVADGEQQRRQVDSASMPEATTATAVATALNDLENCTTPSTAIPAAAMAETWVHPAALESTQRMVAEAVREEREQKRFCMEEERHQLECDRLRYEIEAAKLQLTIDRALARKRLFDAGLPGAQVNELFPK
ncbi:unnamed protein product [Hyaloperonospora brassicae]|uniref:Uncharacterized protein n=1 Tax=Hyaloperonospora brassicae TaxID=162125 RepID=A0AAV0TKH9_HYABA|nr:unnamed protein product [Hyaloperonospora brassicae]